MKAALHWFTGGARKEEVAMDTFNEKLTKQWKDVGNLVLGVWLVISGVVLRD